MMGDRRICGRAFGEQFPIAKRRLHRLVKGIGFALDDQAGIGLGKFDRLLE